ncbi:MAG: hypothetical protein KDB96_15670 [Flavobacteriales bacterium]|nr:hypothetical protein [Flavobacteriales bacterium]
MNRRRVSLRHEGPPAISAKNAHPLRESLRRSKEFNPIVVRLDNTDGSAVVEYGMDNQVKERWNSVVGAQYQLNKHWMLRTAAGLFGNRKSYMLSLKYRFLS